MCSTRSSTKKRLFRTLSTQYLSAFDPMKISFRLHDVSYLILEGSFKFPHLLDILSLYRIGFRVCQEQM